MHGDDNTPPLPEPLAYFLTWTTYGTWLPGDERGWVRRPGVFEDASEPLRDYSRRRQAEPLFKLSTEQRRIVETTIAEHCRVRGWQLWIVRALSNHVHVVVTANGYAPDVVMDQFKAWCTRKLKASRPDEPRQHWWTERGSKRFVSDLSGLEGAVLYVRDAQ